MMTSPYVVSILLCLSIGVGSGLMVGVLGIGGGAVIVPGLLFVFRMHHLIPEDCLMHVASASSFVIMVFASLSSIRIHYQLDKILWSVFNRLWPGLILGVILGVLIADYVSNSYLEMIFGGFLLFIVCKMMFDLTVNRVGAFPSNWINHLVTCFVGFISGLLGVGGGALLVTYLNYCGVNYRKIAAVTNLCTLVIGVIGALSLMFIGDSSNSAIPYSTGYVYWPAVFLVGIPSSLVAPWGSKLNYILPVKMLKYVFITVLFLIAIKMLF